jgi:hypothetical protein
VLQIELNSIVFAGCHTRTSSMLLIYIFVDQANILLLHCTYLSNSSVWGFPLQAATPAQAEQLVSGFRRLVGDGEDSGSSSSRSDAQKKGLENSTYSSNGRMGVIDGRSSADSGGMGRSYQVMAFSSKGIELGALAGFQGGKVVEVEESDRVLTQIQKA